MDNPKEEPLDPSFKKEAEQNSLDGISGYDETQRKVEIVHHGKGNNVHHITHIGEGDIIYQGEAENKRLKAEIRLLKEILKEKEDCVEVNREEHDLIIQSKDDEIKVLKETLEMLKGELQRLKQSMM